MKNYLVTYDLKDRGKPAYDELIDALEKLGGKHAQYSVWLLTSSSTPEQIFNSLNSFLKTGDQLMVIEINRANAWATLQSTSYSALSQLPSI